MVTHNPFLYTVDGMSPRVAFYFAEKMEKGEPLSKQSLLKIVDIFPCIQQTILDKFTIINDKIEFIEIV